MENPHFKNQLKAEIEKTPQENEESLNTEEQESGKRENITLEIDGQTIEAVKYYFEYPERIQKETGILGYERVVIPLDTLEKLKSNNVIYQLLDELSNDEYPRRCHNHVLGFWADKIRHLEYFKQGFFINKIYDISTIEKEGKHEMYPFSNASTLSGDNSRLHANFTIYDKNSNMVSDKEIPIVDILKYKNDILNGNKYASTSFGGLNLTPTDFFLHGPKKDTIGFGFSFELDNFMREYYENALVTEVKQCIKNNLSYTNALVQIVANLKMDDFIKNTKIDYDLILSQNGVDPFFLEENKIIGLHTTTTVENYNEWSKSREWGMQFKSKLPIFIGKDEIPQLSWGHAKYAHYFNDKGFNFFKFKHADHLPTKEEMNSSES